MRKAFVSRLDIDGQFRRIARDTLRDALRAATQTGRNPTSRIHRARLEMKRLRALLQLVREELPDFAEQDAAARDAARALSDARDADVLVATLKRLLVAARGDGAKGTTLIRDAQAHAGDGPSHERVLAEFARSTAALADRPAQLSLEPPTLEALLAGYAGTYRRGRRAFRRARDRGDPADFHEWRKWAKHLGYQVKLLAGVAPGSKGHSDPLARLGDVLGRHHDLTVALGALEARPDRGDLAPVIEAASRERARIERKALKLGRRTYGKRTLKWRRLL